MVLIFADAEVKNFAYTMTAWTGLISCSHTGMGGFLSCLRLKLYGC